MTPTGPPAQKDGRNIVLFVAIISNFFCAFATSALNIAVPHIGIEFHMPAPALSWIVLSFTFMAVLLTLPFGRLADIRGRTPMLKLGIFLVCLASTLNVFSPTMTVFFLLRVLQGVGGAMVFATSFAILVIAWPVERRGWALGVTVGVIYAAVALGPVVGGMITHWFGWRGIFLVISALSLVAFVASLRLPEETKRQNTQRLNVGSILLFMAAVTLVIYGFSTLTQDLLSYFLTVAGVVLLVLFVWHESRVEVPLIDVKLFRDNPAFGLASLAGLLGYGSIFAVGYLMSIYLQIVKGFNADVSGLVLILHPAIQTFVSLIAGRMSDRKSPYRIASSGMAFCALGLAALAFVGEGTPLWGVLAALAVVGTGFGFFASPNTNIIMSSVPPSASSIASSIQGSVRMFGQTLTMGIITILMSLIVGSSSLEYVAIRKVELDIRISFAVFAVLCAAGALISLKQKNTPAGGSDRKAFRTNLRIHR